MNLKWLLLGLVLIGGGVYLFNQKGKVQPPATTPLKGPPAMPRVPSDPGPTPQQPVQPTPPPAHRFAKVLVICGENCSWCAVLKKQWPEGLPYPTEWADYSREIAQKWQVKYLPTLIALDTQGKELKRNVGYLKPAELKAWLEVP